MDKSIHDKYIRALSARRSRVHTRVHSREYARELRGEGNSQKLVKHERDAYITYDYRYYYEDGGRQLKKYITAGFPMGHEG